MAISYANTKLDSFEQAQLWKTTPLALTSLLFPVFHTDITSVIVSFAPATIRVGEFMRTEANRRVQELTGYHSFADFFMNELAGYLNSKCLGRRQTHHKTIMRNLIADPETRRVVNDLVFTPSLLKLVPFMVFDKPHTINIGGGLADARSRWAPLHEYYDDDADTFHEQKLDDLYDDQDAHISWATFDQLNRHSSCAEDITSWVFTWFYEAYKGHSEWFRKIFDVADSHTWDAMYMTAPKERVLDQTETPPEWFADLDCLDYEFIEPMIGLAEMGF